MSRCMYIDISIECRNIHHVHIYIVIIELPTVSIGKYVIRYA